MVAKPSTSGGASCGRTRGLEGETVRAAILTAATNYPTKVVRIIEPFGPGSGPEVIATAVTWKLAELWGQPVTVENHPGAGSTAAPAMVAESPADGYTLLVHTNAHAYSAALLTNLPYDPLIDFVPVAALTTQSYVLVASETAAVTTISALMAAAKAKPGELRFGSTGVGTGTHLGSRNSISQPGSTRPTSPREEAMRSPTRLRT
jgi:tripartite-type tricarboxylate transporter receptor subunit TctC